MDFESRFKGKVNKIPKEGVMRALDQNEEVTTLSRPSKSQNTSFFPPLSQAKGLKTHSMPGKRPAKAIIWPKLLLSSSSTLTAKPAKAKSTLKMKVQDLSTLQAAYRNKLHNKDSIQAESEKLPPIDNNTKSSILPEPSFPGSNPNYSEYVKKMEKMNRVSDYSSVVKALNGENIRKRPQTFEGSSSKKSESKREKAMAFAKSIPKPKSGIKLQKLETPMQVLNPRLEEFERRHQEYISKVNKIKASLNY